MFCLLFVGFSVGAWAQNSDDSEALTPLPIEESHNITITPLEYCQHFAVQYTHNLSLNYIANSLNLQKEPTPKEHIQAQYTCQFKAINGGGGIKDIFVTLFLVEDYELASLIREQRWSILPISYIKESGEEAPFAKLKQLLDNVRPEDSTEPQLLAEGYGIFMSHEKSPVLAPAKEPANLQRGRTPKEYCQSFASAYSQKTTAVLLEDTVVVETEGLADKMEKWVTNFFQPRGSKFLTGYKCLFTTNSKKFTDRMEEVLVYLFLVENYSFAEYTTMDEWQLIPIEYIEDPVDEKEGYGVFKFIKPKADPQG